MWSQNRGVLRDIMGCKISLSAIQMLTCQKRPNFRIPYFRPSKCRPPAQCRPGRMPPSRRHCACHPNSGTFLYFEVLRPLIDAYQLDPTGSLASQIDVCKLLLKQTDKPRNIPDIISILEVDSRRRFSRFTTTAATGTKCTNSKCRCRTLIFKYA